MFGLYFGYARKALDLAMFTRHAAGAMAARAPLAEILSGYAEDADTRTMQKALTLVVPRLEAGMPLSEALGYAPGVFPESYRQVIRLGEKSNTLPAVMTALAQSLEDAVLTHESFRRVAIYPAIIASLLLLIGGFASTILIPRAQDIMAQVSPNSTGVMDNLASLGNFLFIGVLSAILAIFLWLLAIGAGLRMGTMGTGRWVLMLPIIGPSLRMAETARFVQHLGLMLGSKVPLGEAMELLADSTTNPYVRESFLGFRDQVASGQSLRTAVGSVGIFPHSLAQMLASAQERGNLEETLLHLSGFYRERTQSGLRFLREFFEPMLLLVVGILIAWMVMVLYSPMLAITGGAANGW